MRSRTIGILLAGSWFLLSGLIPLVDLHISNLNLIMTLLALAAGVMLLIGK